MLLELMSRRPDDFTNVSSALSQWVLAQHHGLKTRLLDITKNPLVALFHCCDASSNLSSDDQTDGVFHIFAVPKSIIKTYESDTIRSWTKNVPVYCHHKVTVPASRKKDILHELEILHVTKEVLFPGLDESAKAIVRRYLT